MPPLDADPLAAAKRKDKALAAAMGYSCAILTFAAAASAASVAGAPAAIVFGMGAGVTGFLSVLAGRFADDPPRDDVDAVSETAAQIDDSRLPDADSNEGKLARLVAQSMLVCDGQRALLFSLERYNGAIDAGNDDAANAQAEAVRVNSQRTADYQDNLAVIAAAANPVWPSLRDELNLDTTSLTLADVQQFYRDNVQSDSESQVSVSPAIADAVLGAAPDLLEPLTDNGSTNPVLDADALPDPPLGDELFNADFFTALSESSASLRDLGGSG